MRLVLFIVFVIGVVLVLNFKSNQSIPINNTPFDFERSQADHLLKEKLIQELTAKKKRSPASYRCTRKACRSTSRTHHRYPQKGPRTLQEMHYMPWQERCREKIPKSPRHRGAIRLVSQRSDHPDAKTNPG